MPSSINTSQLETPILLAEALSSQPKPTVSIEQAVAERLNAEIPVAADDFESGASFTTDITLDNQRFTLYAPEDLNTTLIVISSNQKNRAPMVLSISGANGESNKSEASALDRALAHYLRAVHTEQATPGNPEFSVSNPNTGILDMNAWKLEPATAKDLEPLQFLKKPDAPEVKALQAQISQQFTETIGDSIESFLQDPNKLRELAATDLDRLLTVVGGEDLPKATLNGEVENRIYKKFFKNQPDTRTDFPIAATYTDPGTGKTTDVVLRPNNQQQQLYAQAVAERQRRTLNAASTIIAEANPETRATVLPYTNAELKKMGIFRGTAKGDAAISILQTLSQRLGDADHLRTVFDPKKVRFVLGYNSSKNDTFDFYANLAAAAISPINKQKPPIAVAKTNSFMQRLLHPETLVVNQDVDPNKWRISLNLPIIQAAAQDKSVPVTEEAVSSITNELSNLLYIDAVNTLLGFTEKASKFDKKAIKAESLWYGMVAEIYSDVSQVWLNMSAEEKAQLNSLAVTDPQQAITQLISLVNKNVADPSNLRWSKMPEGEYQKLRTEGAISETEAAAHRYGVVYKIINGGSPDNLLLPDERQLTRGALALALKNMGGMSEPFVQAYSDYVFEKLLPTAIRASAWMNINSTFDDSPGQHQASLRHLSTNDE